jgi:serine/threonine protein phosphatase PrpC
MGTYAYFQFLGKRNIQQDVYLIDEKNGIAIVCDGIGSNNHSHIFAESYIKAFADFLVKIDKTINIASYETFLNNFQQKFVVDYPLLSIDSNLGCTVAFLKLGPDGFLVGHLGDTKVIYAKEGHVVYESQDHNLFNAIKEEYTESAIDNLAVKYKKQLTKAVSFSEKIDFFDLKWFNSTFDQTESIMILSDGVEIDTQFTSQFSHLSPEMLFSKLKDQASAYASDNATAILILGKKENEIAEITLKNLIIVTIIFIFTIAIYYQFS